MPRELQTWRGKGLPQRPSGNSAPAPSSSVQEACERGAGGGEAPTTGTAPSPQVPAPMAAPPTGAAGTAWVVPAGRPAAMAGEGEGQPGSARPPLAGRGKRRKARRGPPCPRCGRYRLRRLVSGALGCLACACILRREEPSGAAPGPPATPLAAMDAINAMLERNLLVLGPGGIPLTEGGSADPPRSADRPGRRAQQRRGAR